MSKHRHPHHPEQEENSANRKAVSRREFLGALGVSSAGLLLGACGRAKSPVGPAATEAAAGSAATAMHHPMKFDGGLSKVATADVSTYEYQALRKNIESMFNALGGISDVAGGKTVGIKVNLTGGSSSGNVNAYKVPPCELYWTHPEITKVVGELAKDAGASKIYIIEAIYDWKSYNDYGFKDVADYLGAELIDLNQKTPYSDFVERPVGDGWLIYEKFTQCGILNDIDCIISLPKTKQHKGAGYTNAMKNFIGSVPLSVYGPGQGSRQLLHSHRTEFEKNWMSNLRRVVLDLNNATKVRLSVSDAIKTALGSEGPWNRDLVPTAFNKLIASKDVVAADSVSCQVIGFDPMVADNTGVFKEGINYLRLAQEKGMGTYDLAQIEVLDATAGTGVRERQPLS
jgi:uncharacterized protein (DUF362 family)